MNMALLNEKEILGLHDFLKGRYEKKFDAITSYGENILLSAGAGCGKTTALSLRVLYQILCEGLSVSDMLILTFTDNAAREMKERIEKDLRKFAADKNLSFLNPKAREALLDEADKVTTAPISTFDSYANGIVRKYAEKLKVSPSFQILDDVVSQFLFNRTQRKIINGEFDDPSSFIKDYFNANLDTNAKRLKETIVALEDIRESYSDADKIFDEWESRYNDPKVLDRLYRDATAILIERLNGFAQALLNFVSKFKDIPSNASKNDEPEFFFKASEAIKNITEKYLENIDEGDGYENLKNLGNELRSVSFTGGQDKEGLRPKNYRWKSTYFSTDEYGDSKPNSIDVLETLKNTYKGFLDTIAAILPPSLTVDLYQREAKYFNYVISLDRRIHQEVESFKRKNNAYSFFDISSFCLKLLKEDKEARCEERDRVKSIMVDEYQDSNDAQETLLSLLGTSEENYEKYLKAGDQKLLFDRRVTFMVGDVKQSIYSFRFARPELFIRKYESDDTKSLRVLTMEDNFRSNPIVVDQVNGFFSKTMTKNVGGVDYKNDPEQHIRSSNDHYKLERAGNYSALSSLFYDFSDTKIGNVAMRRAIIAQDIAKKIKDLVENKKVKVLSKETGKESEVSYGDFAILVRAKNQADAYIKAFGQLNIPCTVDINQDFKDSFVVMVLENLVTIEYLLLRIKEGILLTEGQKEHLRHCIASVERSFLLDVKDIQLIEDVKYENIVSQNEEKRPLVVRILDKINKEASLKSQSVNQIIREIVLEFDVYSKIATLRDSDISLSSFNFFLNQIDTLCSMGLGYPDIVEFFEELRKGDLKDLTQETKLYRTKGDSVMITTIHKSKGLEYPFVILPMGRKGPSESGRKKTVSFDKEAGFIFKMTYDDARWLHRHKPQTDNGKEWDPASGEMPFQLIQRRYFGYKSKDEAISEQLRIIYVALTRARLFNIMVFETDPKDRSDVLDVLPSNTAQSFEDFGALAYSSVMAKPGDHENYDLEDIISSKDKSDLPYDKEEDVPSFTLKLKEPLKDSLVTMKKEATARASKESTIEGNKENEEFGTKLHLEMECLDWSNFPVLPDASFIVDPREKQMVTKFIESDFIQSLKDQNPSFYQEMKFYDVDTHKEGSIDFAIVTKGTSYVVDYKTNAIIDPAYKRQVRIYRKNLARVHSLNEKKIRCFLYSIMKGEFLEVDLDNE